MARKHKKNKKNKKVFSVIFFLFLFVAASAVVYFVWDGYFRDNEKEDEKTEVVDNDITQDEGGKGAAEGETIEKEPVLQYDGDNPNGAEELTGVVTYAAVSGNNLMIRVNIDQYLDDGNCELNLVQGDVKYSDSAKISSVTTATCEGFNVPVNRLGSGNYQILIYLSSNDKTGTIKGEVNI